MSKSRSCPDAQRFEELSQSVQNGSMKPEAALADVQKMNFLGFDIEDIELVQKADWLPDDVAVKIMKDWMHQQDEILLKLRAHLVLTPTISKDRLKEFTEAIRSPSKEPDLIIKDVIEKIATAGGTRDALNPLTNGLISCSSLSETNDHPIADLFSFEKGKYYMSHSVQGQFLAVSLPPFLQLQVTEYTLGAPPKKDNQRAEGGISSWQLQGSNDQKNWATIDLQSDNKDLARADSVKTFVVEEPEKKGFFTHFKLTHTGQNHQLNFSILLSKFDLSGKLIIHKE